jgi:hypothetical protein
MRIIGADGFLGERETIECLRNSDGRSRRGQFYGIFIEIMIKYAVPCALNLNFLYRLSPSKQLWQRSRGLAYSLMFLVVSFLRVRVTFIKLALS